MSTVPAAIVALVVLSAAGLLPGLALVGARLVLVPLLPLTGSVIAALAATCYLAAGGSFLGWFVGLAVVGALTVNVVWWRWPDRRPWRDIPRAGGPGDRWPTWIGVLGALALLGTCVWCLRGLATPTVGFDARALWLMRAGWFLQPHQQLLIKMQVPDVVLIQSAYPPLVSATTALAWRLTDDQSVRLGVVIIALLNTCALLTAASALVVAGRRVASRLAPAHHGGAEAEGFEVAVPARSGRLLLLPLMVGVVCAVLLVFVAFGITEPFMTNGYADPIWSLAAVGAVAFGLQLEKNRANQGVALILLLVAGMSKDEGVVTGGLLIGLITVRGLVALSKEDRRHRWWRPLLVGVAELAALGAWPVLMRIIHARGDTSAVSPAHEFVSRARASYDGMVPYLHVIVLAAPLAVVGGLALSRLRRTSGLANEWWAWAGLACGLLAVVGAFATGTGAIEPWLASTVHRVTEFSALTGWWIVAMWAVVASAAPATVTRQGRHRPPGLPSVVATEAVGSTGRAFPAAAGAE